MKTIAFDVMGNDNGVRPAVEATIDFLKRNLDYYFILVGDSKEISKYVKDNERIKIMHVENITTQNDKILDSRHQKTSMSEAIKLLRNNEADAVLSSGNSAVYLSLLVTILKRLDNIKRPAFMPIFPTIVPNKKFVMLDVGANVVSNAEMLVQWAKMANVFFQSVFDVKHPKVGILNIGTENNKGHNFHQEANLILKQTSNINYQGFIEPSTLLVGDIDVVVSDGYGGNLVLKTMESTVLSLIKLIKNNLMQKNIYKLGAFLSKGAYKKIKEQLDYRNVGAAWVLGVNGLALKAHSSSNKKAYLGAFQQISSALENNLWTKFKESLK